MHPAGLSSLTAGVAFQYSRGVIRPSVLILQLRLLQVVTTIWGSFVPFPSDGVVEGNSGSLDPDLRPYEVHPVGMGFPGLEAASLCF